MSEEEDKHLYEWDQPAPAEADAWEDAEAKLVLKTSNSVCTGPSYSINTQAEIKGKMKTLMEECVEMLQIHPDEATILLIHYGWNWEKLQAAWFSKEATIRSECGIPIGASKDPLDSQCPVCFEDLDPANSGYLKCNHAFCAGCWKGHLLAQISAGKACLLTKCPFPKCNLRVGPSFFEKYLSTADYEKYKKFVTMSFTDDNKTLKWCPNTNCGLIAENTGPSTVEVTCKCDYVFCFACSSEGHLPVNCEIYKKWIEKSTSESENLTWIKANTKPCPHCKKPIEKNQGCNHMTCSQCKYEFCWICMGVWKAHNGNYNCNKINKEYWDQQESAKNELQRYMFYFERYENHRKAIKKANEQLLLFEEFADIMNKTKEIAFIDTAFLFDALKVLKNVRRVLSNSYIYGYYLKNVKEVQLFEFRQQDLEMTCEQFHEMLERKKDAFIDVEDLTNFLFVKYKTEVNNMMNVIKKFYLEFIDAIVWNH